MDSREFGLVAGQQLTGMEDLHYGLWAEGETPSILGAKEAQNRYTDLILDTVAEYSGKPESTKILDVGCGTGVILKKLLQLGYQVDGVIPAAYLKKQVDQRIASLNGISPPTIYECNFEDFPLSDRNNQYDIVLYSESYQYIAMAAGFTLMKHLLKSDGKVVVCDFFKTEHDGDGGPGDQSFGGGHALDQFYRGIEEHGYAILHDDDITRRISPTIAMVDEILMQRIFPTLQTLSEYLHGRHRFGFAIFKRLFRKKMERLKFKYFSGHRSQAVFERYKSYHHVVLKLK